MKKRMLDACLLVVVILLFQAQANAQLKLGVNPSTINKSSILELDSKAQGLLLTRIPDTTVTSLTTAPDGTIIFFTKDKTLRIRKNSRWQAVVDSSNLWQLAGPAGGDLTGSYPNPTIATDAVTNTKILNSSVTYNKVQNISASNTLLGRYTTGAGPMQEISLGTGLSLNNSTGVLTATGSGGTVTQVTASMPAGLNVSVSNSTTTPNIAVTTTLNGLLRGNGTGFTTGKADLTTEVSGTLPIANGGTGLTTLGTGLQLLRVNSAASSLEYFTPNYLTNFTASAPTGITATVTTTGSTPNLALTTSLNGLLRGNGTGFTTGKADLTTEVSGTLPIANGGTGLATFGTGLQLLRVNSAASSLEYFTPNYLTNFTASAPTGITATVTTTGSTPNLALTTSLNGLLRGNGTGFTTGKADLTTEVSGTLPIANGGTGLATFGTGLQLLRVNSAASSLEYFTPNYLTNFTASAPTGITATVTTTGSTPNLALTTSLNGLLRGNGSGFTTGKADLTTEVSGTLPIANGGTGLATFGTGLQLLRVNSAASSLEYFTPNYLTNFTASTPTGITATVTTTGSTPNLALTTSLNGLLRGNGTGFTTGKADLTTEVSGILPIANGGTGLSGLGSALQLLRVNSAANGLEYVTPNYWTLGGNSVTSVQKFGTTSNYDLPIITNNVERMRITAAGDVGIGVTDPTNPFVVKDTLEIRRVSSTATLLFTNTSGSGDFRIGGDGGDIFWQGGGGRNLQMGAYWGINFMGDRGTSGFPAGSNGSGGYNVLIQAQKAASIPLIIQAATSQSSNLTEWRDVNGNGLNVVTPAGAVGIGTTSPNASTKLDVSGGFKLGTSGTALSGIIKSNQSVTDNTNNITSTQSLTKTVTVTGATTNASVTVNPRSALPNGVAIAYSYVSAANTITVNFINSSSTAVKLGSITFDITVIQ